MKKYTYITDHPRNRMSKDKYIHATSQLLRELDMLSVIKVFAYTRRLRRDKVK